MCVCVCVCAFFLGVNSIRSNHISNTSEDCLYLNVFTPRVLNASSLLPTLFWIHGGCYHVGDSRLYPAFDLATSTNAVVVSIHYRLGALAWWGMQTLIDSGDVNRGFLDQRLALEWAHRNIESFGGDPSRLLVFGQSAGGGSTAAQLLLQHGKQPQLFSAAAMESPDTMDSRGLCSFLSKAEALNRSHAIMQRVGCAAGSSDQRLACMRTISVEKLRDWDTFPMVDGIMFPDWPAALFQLGRFERVPVIVGSTALENARDACSLWGQLGATEVNRSSYDAVLRKRYPQEFGEVQGWYSTYAEQNGRWLAFARIQSDYGYICPTHRFAMILSSFTPTYRYWWSHITVDWRERSCYNASHDAETPYVFCNPKVVPYFLGYGSFNAQETRLSNSIASMWRRMAAEGTPHSVADGFAPAWPRYNPTGTNGGQGKLMQFALPPSVVEFPVLEFCEHWDNISTR